MWALLDGLVICKRASVACCAGFWPLLRFPEARIGASGEGLGRSNWVSRMHAKGLRVRAGMQPLYESIVTLPFHSLGFTNTTRKWRLFSRRREGSCFSSFSSCQTQESEQTTSRTMQMQLPSHGTIIRFSFLVAGIPPSECPTSKLTLFTESSLES